MPWRHVSKLNYDAEDELVLNSKGYAYILRSYNADKKVIREVFCDADGNPMEVDGFTATEMEYDGQGRVIYQRYLDEEDQPKALSKGYCAVRKSYEDLTKPVLTEYLQADGDPAVITDGYASVANQYDEAGRVTYEGYLDQRGNPIAVSKGYCAFTRSYDEDGLLLTEAYFDKDGNRTTPDGVGYSAVTYTYTDSGKKRTERYLDPEDAFTAGSSDYAGKMYEYNDDGQVTREIFLDPEGNRMFSEDAGYSVLLHDYDEQGRESGRSYLDSNDELTEVDGVARIAYSYAEDGSKLPEEKFDREGNPVVQE